MEGAPTCIVCGCELSAGVEVCPVCGAALGPVKATPASGEKPTSGERGAAPRHGRASHLRRGQPSHLKDARHASARQGTGGAGARTLPGWALPVIAGVLMCALLVCGAVVLGVWRSDDALHSAAVEASSAAAGDRRAHGPVGLPTGNAAAGGLVTWDDSQVAWVSGDEVRIAARDGFAGDAWQAVDDAGAYGLCLADGTLYYLSGTLSASDTSFCGSGIRAVGGDGESRRVVLEETGPVLSCLAVQGKALFALRGGGDAGLAVIRLPLDGSQAPEELCTLEATAAWLFAEGDALWCAYTTRDSWALMRARLVDDGLGNADFVEESSGEGELRCALLSGTTLYYALAADSPRQGCLRSCDLSGGFREYADVPAAMRVAASGDVVAVLCADGRLVWVDAVTSVVHDLTPTLRERLGDVRVRDAALAVFGEWVCVRSADGSGACIETRSDGRSAPL